jgi:hypothetical protein
MDMPFRATAKCSIDGSRRGNAKGVPGWLPLGVPALAPRLGLCSTTRVEQTALNHTAAVTSQSAD